MHFAVEVAIYLGMFVAGCPLAATYNELGTDPKEWPIWFQLDVGLAWAFDRFVFKFKSRNYSVMSSIQQIEI